MEAAPHRKTGLDDWAERFSTSLHRQRDRVREFLCAQRERLTRAEGELTVQLRSLAEQLAEEHAESQQARGDLDAQRRAIAAEASALERLRGQLDERDSQWDRVQSNAVDQQQQLFERLVRHQEEMERQCRELAAVRADSAIATATASETEQRLREEITALKGQCRSLRSELETPSAPSTASDAVGDHHGQLARNDELLARNDELQQQINRLRAETVKPSSPAGQVLDWEAEKRRILAELEQDSVETPQAKSVHSEINSVIERTDRVIAGKDRLLVEKDREIAELKTLLENQSANVGAMAVGAAALGDMFNTDEIIHEQRESLKQLQEELQKKLRTAEIEISLERAKIARERSTLEERLRKFEEQNPAPSAAGDEHGKDAPQRGRWLSRMGLKEEDHKPKA